MSEKDGIDKALNAKQLRFVDEYLIDANATQAAIRAGYSKRTAAEQGYELLRKPEIYQVIQAKQAELAVALGITRNRIILELSRIAFSDPRQLYRRDGSLKPVSELDDDIAAAIALFDTVELSDKHGPVSKKIKLWDKLNALERLMKYLGMDRLPDTPLTPVAEVNIGFDELRAAFKKRLGQAG